MEKLNLPRFAQRYDYVQIKPEAPFESTLLAGQYQSTKKNIRYNLFDRTGIYNWNDAYFEVNFYLDNKANGTALPAEDKWALNCGSQSLISRLVLENQDGDTVYECSQLDRAAFIKKLLTQTKDWAETVGQDEFWYLDSFNNAENLASTTRVAECQAGTNDNPINVKIPLRNYSVFASMDMANVLISGIGLRLLVDIADDQDCISTVNAAATVPNPRLVIKDMNLWLPNVVLHPQYVDNYTRNITKGSMIEWTYRRERVQSLLVSDNSGEGSWRINGITNPKKLIFYFTNRTTPNQKTNPQHFASLFTTTNGIGTNQVLRSARIEVGSDNITYPRNDYKSSQLSRMYSDTTLYSHIDGTDMGLQMTRNFYRDVYSMIYIDLDYRKQGVISDNTDITFNYVLSGGTAEPYTIFCIIEYENDAKFGQRDGSFVITSSVSK